MQILVKHNGRTVNTISGISLEDAKKMYPGAELVTKQETAKPTVEKNSNKQKTNYYLLNIKVEALGYKNGEQQLITKPISLHILDMMRYPVEKDGKTQHVPMRSSKAKEDNLAPSRFILNNNWYTLDQTYLDKVYTPELVSALTKLGFKKQNTPVLKKDAHILIKAYLIKRALEQKVKIDETQMRPEDITLYTAVKEIGSSLDILEKLDLYRVDRVMHYSKKRELYVAKAKADTHDPHKQLKEEGLQIEDLPASMAEGE